MLGNTSPVSSFRWSGEKLASVVASINEINPVFIIHSGNMVRGGHSWMGINKKDMKIQFRKFFSEMKKIDSQVYTVAGEKDFLDHRAEIYRRFSGKEMNYSFNYGKSHFVIINSINRSDEFIDFETEKWLIRDLDASSDAPAVFIITHRPVFVKIRNRMKVDAGKRLHIILKKYRVKAVFSGGMTGYYDYILDGIRYTVTGCDGYRDRNIGKFQYYVIDFNGINYNIKPVHLNF